MTSQHDLLQTAGWSDDALSDSIGQRLKHAGYEVSTDYDEGMKSVLAFNPDAVILVLTPPKLDCCMLSPTLMPKANTRMNQVTLDSNAYLTSIAVTVNKTECG